MNEKFEQKISDYKKRSEKKSKKEKKLPVKEVSVETKAAVPVAVEPKEPEKPKPVARIIEQSKPKSNEMVFEKSPLSKAVDEILEGFEPEKSRYGGRQKIDIKFINDKARRGVTFSKRKSGMLKKAHELSILTGADILLVISTNPGKTVFTYASDNFQPFLQKEKNQKALLSCLKSSEEGEEDEERPKKDE